MTPLPVTSLSVMSHPIAMLLPVMSNGTFWTEYGTALTTILPILFLYLNTVTVTAGTFKP
jgi:hypothetical protein